MAGADDQQIRKGDRGFVLRLIGAAAVVVLLTVLVLGILDDSELGSCASRGFLQLTEPPSSD